MSPLTVIIGILVGLAAGMLIVLVADYYLLGKPFQAMLRQKQNLYDTLQSTNKKYHQTSKSLVKSQAQTSRMQDSLTRFEEKMGEQVLDNQKLQRQLSEAESEIDVLHGNLKRVTDYTDKLQEKVQTVCEQYETAVADSEALSEELNLAHEEINTLQAENQAAYQEIAASEAHIQQLVSRVTKLEPLAETAVQFEAQKDALANQLSMAEAHIENLKQVIASVTEKLSTSTESQQKIDEAEQKLRLAHSKITGLQMKLEQMGSQLEYTGKNQLQIIKGIGPTYAKRLNEAGIMTLGDLSKADPVRVTAIVQLKPWQNHDPADWIEEAGQLSLNGSH